MKYEDLVSVDILERAVDDIKRGGAVIKGDKLSFTFAGQHVDVPWLFKKVAMDRDCIRWHKVYFDMYGLHPKQCFHCWKIVCRPKNLDELFELSRLQDKQISRGGLPCKCGVEIRAGETYKGNYLGFWYCPIGDLEGAKEHYKNVRREVRGALSLDTPVVLKRGCTEMENAFGPSHLWQYTPEMRRLEMILDSAVEIDYEVEKQSLLAQAHIAAFWIGYAHRQGDPTAKKYIRHYPESMGSVPTITYHDKHPTIVEEVVKDEQETEIQGLSDN